MAANFSRAETYATPPNSQINHYRAQQISPVNSASATPLNVSPTSPRITNQLPYLPLHTRQLRPPKSPLYVPAVLRPTERPVRQSPLTPPRSVHGSLDSLDGSEAGRTLSRRSTGESMKKAGLGRLVEDERTGESGLDAVTGLPTREHWKVSASPWLDAVSLCVCCMPETSTGANSFNTAPFVLSCRQTLILSLFPHIPNFLRALAFL